MSNTETPEVAHQPMQMRELARLKKGLGLPPGGATHLELEHAVCELYKSLAKEVGFTAEKGVRLLGLKQCLDRVMHVSDDCSPPYVSRPTLWNIGVEIGKLRWLHPEIMREADELCRAHLGAAA